MTSPVPVRAGATVADLAALVAADELARKAGVGPVLVPALDGDHAGWLALERSGRAAADFDAARLQAINELTDLLGVNASVEVDTPTACRTRQAATVAFVRLYEEGLVDDVEEVVAECPSCATVIEGSEAIAGQLEADVLFVRLNDHLVVPVVAPELIEGCVAVAVPVGASGDAHEVSLPLGGRRVPVIEEPGRLEPALVVPSHDRQAHEFARVHGLPHVRVLDAEATRYASRLTARELLEAEAAVVNVAEGHEDVERCRHCGSIAVPALGRHWVLQRNAIPGVGSWCLDRRLPGGVPLPVATCEECGRASVDVTASARCGKCLGSLRRDTSTLDARFVAALWPLALAGWPDRPLFLRRRSGQPAASEPPTAVVAGDASTAWSSVAAALAQHLTGEKVFEQVIVQHAPAEVEDVDALMQLQDRDTIRRALLGDVGSS